jgi:hypothetical protein
LLNPIAKLVIELGKRDKQRLISLWEEINAEQRRSLLDFAEFLSQRATAQIAGAEVEQKSQPQQIDRPENENIINAIKRLRATYPMLNTDELLDGTSTLMTQHIVHGRDAVTVIDDLEALFDKHFQKYLQS